MKEIMTKEQIESFNLGLDENKTIKLTAILNFFSGAQQVLAEWSKHEFTNETAMKVLASGYEQVILENIEVTNAS
ncbi:hypothetical protein DIX60_10100 [Streptococcus iniae]|uniref:hypothetical protein n=1 Tax=Streptococcus iniae TaxID=1346 RepID=UPI0008D96436|nr:hypothetical protein [Streptococcus iniae]OHX28000.1 hypothetical protein BKX95_02220 [Streptococcus iniae]RLV26829.1 hypothetical protein DIX60_10100 [Streptococcus iniae]